MPSLANATVAVLGWPSGQQTIVCGPNDNNSKCGPNAENSGSVLGRVLSINCDGNCIQCNVTGTTMNINFNPSCSGGGSFDLLLEDGSYILLESGGKIIL